MLLDKNSIKQLKKKETVFKSKDYDVEIKIIGMSLENQLNIEADDNNKFFCNVIRFCCVDEKNEPLFDTNEDVQNLPCDFARDLFNCCIEINNLGNKDVEKLAKN